MLSFSSPGNSATKEDASGGPENTEISHLQATGEVIPPDPRSPTAHYHDFFKISVRSTYDRHIKMDHSVMVRIKLGPPTS
jgi:hypothetical protein